MVLLLIFALIFVCHGATELSFSATDDSISARTTTVGTWSWLAWSGVYFHSVEVVANNSSFSGDYIWGQILSLTGSFPLTWISYFSAGLNVHRNISDPNNFDWLNFTVDESSGFVASSYIGLEEVTPAGEIVKNHTFNHGLWTYDAAASTAMSNTSAGLYASVFNHLVAQMPTLRVQLIYVMTERAGTLNLRTKAFIVPKAIESFINIQNWPYQNKENSLRLTMICGTAKADWSASGSVTSGSGKDGTYFHVAKDVVADGKVTDVKISSEISSEGLVAFQNENVETQLTSKYSGSVSVHVVQVTFPAGAEIIEYDPSTGVGDNPYNELGLTIGFIILIVFGCVALLAATVFGAYFILGKRGSYDSVH